ncbi:MAG: hypothetical protein LIP77_04505 [Planctomycetes bacterium]|nr:hypothetical protein [Planctomycetota bacterium]
MIKVLFGLGMLALLLVVGVVRAEDSMASLRERADREWEKGNYKEAGRMYARLINDPANDTRSATRDVERLSQTIGLFADDGDPTAVLEEAAVRWRDSWRVLTALADWHSRRGGRYVSPAYRVRSLTLFLQAEAVLDRGPDPATVADKRAFYEEFAAAILRHRPLWQLTELTDLTPPDDPAEPVPYGGYWGPEYAPAAADGGPVFYPLPASWAEATNDGERWRWVIGPLAALDPAGRDQADRLRAEFLLRQFGVQTLGLGFPDEEVADTGPFAVRTLGEDETIARLITGPRRFSLPDEHNYIRIFRRLADEASGGARVDAAWNLARIFENRNQYPKAVAWWDRVAADPAASRDQIDAARQAAAIITEASGRLEPGATAVAGRPASIPYLFRNARQVTMTAYRVDEKRLLDDLRTTVKSASRMRRLEHSLTDPAIAIGLHAVGKKRSRYIREKTAEWEVALTPLPDYRTRRVVIDLPFTEAGCYLVEAATADGGISRAVIWLADLALAEKAVGGHRLYYVADAASGEPVAGATLSFLGSFWDYENYRSTEFAVHTDDNGLAVVDAGRLAPQATQPAWLVTALAPDGRAAYLGFNRFWSNGGAFDRDRGVQPFCITDRPVYRPGQTVAFKVWFGRPTYGRPEPVPEHTPVTVEIRDPRGETVYSQILHTDASGGVADSVVFDAAAPLGHYTVAVTGRYHGSVGFRLEEYRKPEYEVVVETPDAALSLGDTAAVLVRAAYYYGAPVTDATVRYSIRRAARPAAWQPPWEWDWLYGPGAWRSPYHYDWLPGGSDGSAAAMPPIGRFPDGPPELVATGEGRLDADGVFRLTLDTLPAKEAYGDTDHQYDITVEVTDASRRTIVGAGRVVAARQPFTATVWADRGYYGVGDAIQARLAARTPLGGGLATTGTATLYRIAYGPDGTPAETPVATWPVATDADGDGLLRLQADGPGQYRLVCVLTDAGGREVEGAAVLTVRGAAGEGEFRFAALELVPDRRDYRPGDTMRLAVNSEHPSAVVLLLPRAERNGHTAADGASRSPVPQVVRLVNGSAVVELAIGSEDQPNFYCDAVTIFDGRIHTETRQIPVPPADKTLRVAVAADKDAYLPGETARFAVTVTDNEGRPVAGQCGVSLYDRSVEYISGGGNVPDIRAHFWSWKRYYSASLTANLLRHGYPVAREKDKVYRPIGAFGRREADWNTAGYGAAPAPAMRRSAEPAVELFSAADAAPEPAPPTGGGEANVEPVVRSEFADTVLWIAALDTDADGRAAFEAVMPDNLTAWKARTWVMADGVRVGEGENTVETRKNVIIRPQAPRFLTQKDRVVLTANLHNYLPRRKRARAELVLEGGLLQPADGETLVREVEIAADGEVRVDWLVDAVRPGEARVVMRLLTDEESDAAQITLPVIVHGSRRVENFGGIFLSGDTELVIPFRVPDERLPDQSRLELTFSQSVASELLETLPFLIDYPYGCTEQTLNRFLPAVMTRRFLDRLGVTLADARPVAAEKFDARQEAWQQRFGDVRRERRSPVFDDAALADMVRVGVERLTAMQNADGGWGWFSGAGERSWPHTTAVVVYGLLAAREHGAAIPPAMVDAGRNWLRAYRNEQVQELQRHLATVGREGKAQADNLDAFIHLILADEAYFHPDMRDFLYRDRGSLSLSGLCMLGLALHREGAGNFLEVVLQNLEQYLEENHAVGTVRLRLPDRGWWWWYHDPVETQAWYLKLLARVEPGSGRAAGLARYLLRNRKNGRYWSSTRDTARAVEALAEYAAASGEDAPDMTVTVYLDERQVMRRRLTAATLLDDNRFVLEGLAVEAGEHSLRLVREGSGNVYYGGGLDLFSLEDPIARAGHELQVERTWYRLTPVDASVSVPDARGVAGGIRVEQFRRDRIPTPFDGDDAAAVPVASGDTIEVELTITAANAFEYLVFEDMKAAGLEAVELQSGYTNNPLGAYIEYRDQKVVLFVRYLPEGTYTIRYRFRAETPGQFSALPVVGGGMYATDLNANSDEMKLRVGEEGVFE